MRTVNVEASCVEVKNEGDGRMVMEVFGGDYRIRIHMGRWAIEVLANQFWSFVDHEQHIVNEMTHALRRQ